MLGLNRNVWLLAIAQPFALAISPAIILVSGFIGKQIAPVPQLATLPLSVMVIGIAVGAVPAAFLMQRYDRKTVFVLSMLVLTVASLISSVGVMFANFWIFLVGILVSGMTIAALHQFRFAAVEHVESPELNSRAISVLMFGSIAAAFIGTELATLGKDLFAVPYAGSFLTIPLASLTAFFLLLFYKNAAPSSQTENVKSDVNWQDILKRPTFIVAVTSASIGYGVMSFVMTATPLAMHDMMGHSLGETKFVIQSHIVAMFLPSLFTGEIIRKFGELKVIFVGLLAYLGTTSFAYSGVEVFHYWWALVLLGVGWNFLFIGGTSLLTKAYQPSEKFRVQAANDMTVFVFQALSSVSAGFILFMGGWSSIVTISLIPTTLLVVLVLLLWRKAKNRTEEPISTEAKA